MHKAICVFLLLMGVLLAGCGSDSGPAAPVVVPLRSADLLGAWKVTVSPLTLGWEDMQSQPVTHSLSNVRFELTVEEASYRLTAESNSGSVSYSAEEWGFWEIGDAQAGRVNFSPQHLEKTLIQELDKRRVTEKMNGTGTDWSCLATVSDSSLQLKGMPSLFDLSTTTLSLILLAE